MAVSICSTIVKQYCNVFYMHCYPLLGHGKKKILPKLCLTVPLVTITTSPYGVVLPVQNGH